MDVRSQGESISRPSTACSGFSDSSVSSSIESFPSLGGSFTSPESDVFERKVGAETLNSTPDCLPAAMQPCSHRSMTASGKSTTSWSEEMDNHLWMTYMRYLQDPTHTPFKMLPGTAPPLGVCSRVVREAKRTWKGVRGSSSRTSRLVPWSQACRADSPDTIKAAHSGNTTPTDSKPHKYPWPRSDAATRRRLRQLCKRKPSLSGHYNRLLSARSPSPHRSAGAPRSSSVMGELDNHFSSMDRGSSFSTREMNVSLLSCSSSTITTLGQIQGEGNLHHPVGTIDSVVYNSRGAAHQKSQSLDMGSSHHVEGSDSLLASPFQPVSRTNTEDILLPSMSLHSPPGATPRLASPLRLSLQLSSTSQGFKRPIGGELLPNQSNGANQLAPDGDSIFPGISSRRIRARGFSLGDVSESSRRLSRLFERPSAMDPTTSIENIGGLNQNDNFMPSSQHRSLRRLGSPFSEKPPKHHFNTFPRNFSIQSLEPTPETQEERFGGLDIPSHAPPSE
jgi:hypothetical protein